MKYFELIYKLSTYPEVSPYQPVYDYTDTEKCPVCGRIISSAYWTHPRCLEIGSDRFPDFAWPTPYPAVSQKVKELWETAELRGVLCFDEIEKYRVRKRKKSGEPKYYTMKTVRSRAEIDYEKSEIIWLNDISKEQCDLCNVKGKVMSKDVKLVLNMENHNGADLFKIYERGDRLFCSERFKELCENNKLTNIHFLTIETTDN